VWEANGLVDLYTNTPENEVRRPQVDHIFEIQMLKKIYEEEAVVAARTRQGHKQFKKVKNNKLYNYGHRPLYTLPHVSMACMGIDRYSRASFGFF
jgi:hypothetical protein